MRRLRGAPGDRSSPFSDRAVAGSVLGGFGEQQRRCSPKSQPEWRGHLVWRSRKGSFRSYQPSMFMAGRRDRAGSLPQGAGPRHLPLRGYPWLVNTVGARDTSFRDGRARGTSQIHFKISVCSHGFIDSVFGGEGHTLTRRNQYGRVGPVEKRQAHETAPNSNCVRDVVFTNNSSLTSGAACTRVELAAVKRVAAQQGQRVTVLRHD